METDAILRAILEHFYVSERGLIWNWVEDVSLAQSLCLKHGYPEDDARGRELERACLPYLARDEAAELREIHSLLEKGAAPCS